MMLTGEVKIVDDLADLLSLPCEATGSSGVDVALVF
jgi:hypothetical protein